MSKAYSYLEGTSGANSSYVGQLLSSSKQFFYDHSGRLIAETVTKNFKGTGEESQRILFLYDGNTVVGMERAVGSTLTRYYFQRNLQGDVEAIYDLGGNLKAKYIYDAWGNCTISSQTTDYAVANANPIRYRGYYYDDDTGLYYCNARYYSPKWRRFISPDDTAYLDPDSPNGLNLYCYCGNDPSNRVDPSGHMPVWAIVAAILLLTPTGGLAVQAATSIVGYAGMAVAQWWDQDWGRHHSAAYSSLHGPRGFDDMDEYIVQNILGYPLDSTEAKQIVNILLCCAQKAVDFIRHEQIESQTVKAFHIFARTVKVMFRTGAALQLHRLGYKFHKVDLSRSGRKLLS